MAGTVPVLVGLELKARTVSSVPLDKPRLHVDHFETASSGRSDKVSTHQVDIASLYGLEPCFGVQIRPNAVHQQQDMRLVEACLPRQLPKELIYRGPGTGHAG